ncbi:hypothetical protein Ancab_011960 [Ancistrocladus abbreviatus]
MNTGYQVLFNESGKLYEAAEDESLPIEIFPNAPSAEDFYLRATIDYDGVFRQYVYPKSSKSSARTWPKARSVQSFKPPNICTQGCTCWNAQSDWKEAALTCLGFDWSEDINSGLLDKDLLPRCRGNLDFTLPLSWS